MHLNTPCRFNGVQTVLVKTVVGAYHKNNCIVHRLVLYFKEYSRVIFFFF